MSSGMAAGEVTGLEQRVLAEVLRGLRAVRHGSVQVVIQDGRAVQIETVEKKRLDR